VKKSIEIKKSRNGQGVFACKKFLAGEVIFEIKGKFISGDLDEELDEATRDNAFRFSKEKYLSPQGRIGDFLNHSCEPNARVVKKVNKLFIYAVQEVKPSEEILFDYSTLTASDDIWEMKCNCGSQNCRGVIKQFKTLPKKIKEKYLSLKMVPKYILLLT